MSKEIQNRAIGRIGDIVLAVQIVLRFYDFPMQTRSEFNWRIIRLVRLKISKAFLSPFRQGRLFVSKMFRWPEFHHSNEHAELPR
jgi:hypothetical protein